MTTSREFDEICRTYTGRFRKSLSRCTPRQERRFFSHPYHRDRSDPLPKEYGNLEVRSGFKPIYTTYNCRCCITGIPIKKHKVIFWIPGPKGRSTLSIEGYALHTGQTKILRENLLRQQK